MCLGILANLMVCGGLDELLGRTLTDKMLAMVLPVGMFCRQRLRAQHRQHVYDPLGIVVKHFATPEFWQAVGAVPEQFAHLTVNNFIIDNLIPVTIGNIIGGGSAGWVDLLGNLSARGREQH
ncbi:formate/nitrite transporter family protein [Serratia ureilytica]